MGRRILTPEERLQSKKNAKEKHLQRYRLLYPKVRKKKRMNSKKERVYQEEITKIWHLTGIFQLPDEEVIEEKLKKEELLYEDTTEDVNLDDISDSDELQQNYLYTETDSD